MQIPNTKNLNSIIYIFVLSRLFMYPYNFYNLFPPFPHDNKVFVAMSFDEKFKYRWEKVIEPAIKSVPASSSSSDVMLEPYRVDMRVVSDSIITDIVSGIGNCRLVFADISALEYFDDQKNKVPSVNQNVAYELGIAHAVRLPEEVILFKSDDEHLMFDLVSVRVNKYKPDDYPEKAKCLVKEALMSAIEEIDLRKHLSVKHAVDSLTFECIQYLLDRKLKENSVIYSKELRSLRNSKRDSYRAASITLRSNTIQYLLDLGIIRVYYPELKSDLFTVGKEGLNEYSGKRMYPLTPFGEVVTKEIIARLGLSEKLKLKPVRNKTKLQKPSRPATTISKLPIQKRNEKSLHHKP